jgi:hypothetical protein
VCVCICLWGWEKNSTVCLIKYYTKIGVTLFGTKYKRTGKLREKKKNPTKPFYTPKKKKEKKKQ